MSDEELRISHLLCQVGVAFVGTGLNRWYWTDISYSLVLGWSQIMLGLFDEELRISLSLLCHQLYGLGSYNIHHFHKDVLGWYLTQHQVLLIELFGRGGKTVHQMLVFIGLVCISFALGTIGHITQGCYIVTLLLAFKEGLFHNSSNYSLTNTNSTYSLS